MDSLPYIDEIHEDYEQYAASLIEEEMQNMDPGESTRKVSPMAPLRFRSPLLEQEYQRVASTGELPDDRPNFKVKLEAPVENSLEAWEEAVKKAKIALEKERIRGIMLELEKEGVTAEQWKSYNSMLSRSGLEPSLQAQRQRVEVINMNRQEYQEKAGKEIHVLTSQYHQLIDKTYHLKCAVAQMEQEIGTLK
mmetsp:Transcript_22136/g.28639  ORF Transcript_22136/g.28639 Transcript_22136/m.28639 type:complete len:193 (-) Transcript_22136:220-798(-)|eukprot:CAMPEP_0198148186 /NCGR_PEP_ID=MMETSP1443-20131203/40323_1 /TAXON_ID=186043 /ORGANISM="Entomoneis sp., Strain CCMP2396" /LENGTH=192 /DNA_ID=CAMNT_0043812809 /DNA_START=17 /DNA_END=595 /DNA_ORIENTATION=+